MNSYSTAGDSHAQETTNFPNALYITPILTQDAVAMDQDTYMFQDSDSGFRTPQASFIDLHPLIPTINSTCSLNYCSNLDWSTPCANMAFHSDFIYDLTKGTAQLGCMLSPGFQDFPQHTSQLFCPVSSSFGDREAVDGNFPASQTLVPDMAVVRDYSGNQNQKFKEGVDVEEMETDQLLTSYGTDHLSFIHEESLLMATQIHKTVRVETRSPSCEGEIGVENDQRVVYPQPEMFTSNASADIAWIGIEPTKWMTNACGKPKANRGGKKQKNSSNQVNKRELVDLRTLLIQCAEAVGSNDFRNANDFILQIRNHSSPFGNASQRKAHYFAKALEARLAGTGNQEYAALVSKTIPNNAKFEACKLLISACPFIKVSNFLATEMILNLSKLATTIHIIHFGIPSGLQWTSLIQHLATRPGHPPMLLRVTGIDRLPEPGLDSAARVEETGLFLAKCCKHFNIPFEYNPVIKNWESIQLEDLKISRNEMVIVNCLYRLRHVIDETDDLSSPRDEVLNLVRKIKPDIFIHGIVNGNYNAPFFVSRFREALYYFSTVFDMLEEILPSENQERMVLEEHIYGKEILNVVACEGLERVERPETFKQWHVRNLRAGLKQLPLNRELLENAKTYVKLHYHKEFLVYEEKNWMLQGWKGRYLFGLSFWRPAKESNINRSNKRFAR